MIDTSKQAPTVAPRFPQRITGTSDSSQWPLLRAPHWEDSPAFNATYALGELLADDLFYFWETRKEGVVLDHG